MAPSYNFASYGMPHPDIPATQRTRQSAKIKARGFTIRLSISFPSFGRIRRVIAHIYYNMKRKTIQCFFRRSNKKIPADRGQPGRHKLRSTMDTTPSNMPATVRAPIFSLKNTAEKTAVMITEPPNTHGYKKAAATRVER